MSAELSDWLAELRAAQPATALRVGAALTLLLDSAELPGPPLVTNMSGGATTDPQEQLTELDYMYQRLVAGLSGLHRDADSAGPGELGSRVRIRRGEPPEQVQPTADEVAAAERRMRELNVALQHWSAVLDEFHASKEVIKASFRAAAGVAGAQRSVLAATDLSEADRASAEAELHEAEQQLAKGRSALARLLARAAAIQRGLAQAAIDPAGRDFTEPLDLPEGLLELHADPLGSDTRFLFAVEPAGTITLLAVLDSAEAVRQHRDIAVDLACGLLVEIRDQGWPAPADGAATNELTFADSGTFLHKFFPADIAAVNARATELATVRQLAGLRRDQGLSVAELARRSGLSPQQVADIEFGGLPKASIADAADYIAALGGLLRLTADLGPGEETEISG